MQRAGGAGRAAHHLLGSRRGVRHVELIETAVAGERRRQLRDLHPSKRRPGSSDGKSGAHRSPTPAPRCCCCGGGGCCCCGGGGGGGGGGTGAAAPEVLELTPSLVSQAGSGRALMRARHTDSGASASFPMSVEQSNSESLDLPRKIRILSIDLVSIAATMGAMRRFSLSDAGTEGLRGALPSAPSQARPPRAWGDCA
jgi:hypothetical protein